MRSVAWVVLVAKDGHKAVDSKADLAGRGVPKEADNRADLAERAARKEVAFQVEASHNPDKDSTW